MLDKSRLRECFRCLGGHLAGRSVFLEIAVYGGSAIVMQFAWRQATEDVDAVVRPGYDERLLPDPLQRARFPSGRELLGNASPNAAG